MQECRTCKIIKNLSEFSYRKDNQKYNTQCKLCISEYKKLRHQKIKITDNLRCKDRYKNNKILYSENARKYYFDNKKEIAIQKRDYCANNKEKIKNYYIVYKSKENKIHKRSLRRIWENNRLKNDPAFKLRKLVSRHISLFLKLNNSSKCGKSVKKYLSYSFDELKSHIENQFESWMTWDNHGNYKKNIWNDNDQSTWTWQIDHIIPHSTFHYISMEDQEFRDCWALSNLRPLSAKQNFLEGINRLRHKKINA